MAVSIPPDLIEAYHYNLLKLNELTKAHFGPEENWIPPLPLGEVTVKPKDRWRIHYTIETTSKVVRLMENFVFGDDTEDFQQA